MGLLWFLLLLFPWTTFGERLTIGKKVSKCSRSADYAVIEELLSDYDKNVIPISVDEKLNITMEFHIQEISGLMEVEAELVLDIMYSEIWYDERLSFKNFSLCDKTIAYKADFRRRIWTPDTLIVNSRETEIHNSPSSNTFLIIHEDGRIWTNWRMKVSCPCKLDTKMFPFDFQECRLAFETLTFTADEVHLQWHPNPVTVMGTIDLPDFRLLHLNWSAGTDGKLSSGSDRLVVTFSFARMYGFYLLQVYFPSGMTVVCSWFSFSFHPLNVSARVTLGFSTFLALAFQFSSEKIHPKFSDVKCIDVWMLACILFIFATLPQMIFVYHMGKIERKREVQWQAFELWLAFVAKKRKKRLRKAQLAMEQAKREAEAKMAANWQILCGEDPDEMEPPVQQTNMDDDSPCSEVSTVERFRVIEPPPQQTNSCPLCLRVVGRALCGTWRWLRNIKVKTAQIDTASLTMFPLGFGLFNAIYWHAYYVRRNVGAEASEGFGIPQH